MVYFLYALFFISCIVLIASVLLQPGKTDAGALFTSNVSSTAFQPRGSQTILSKITIAAATTFMLSALLLAMPALTGNFSVLQTNAEDPTETAPGANVNANTEAEANAPVKINTNVEANTTVTIDAPTPSNVTTDAKSNSASNTNTANANTQR
ncbi:MAG: preprotein translocase subunit SecG [Acidobacteria bacterium]|nr:preprotein translocase subunit SecG [Acidobacteriota bacterium]MCA1637391.1 preprotein translocase subunit SecG [Acidobacteriota bacterium]